MPTLWDKLNDFQAIIARVQAQAPNPKDKQLLGEMLQHIQASQTLAKEKLEALLDDIQNQADDFKLKFEVAQQELEQAKNKAEALQDQAAKREALEKELRMPKVKIPSLPTIDPRLGQQLRDELLAKLPRPVGPVPSPVDPGSVKEDIFTDGNTAEPRPANEWPEELRTPSSKKSARKPLGESAPKKSPIPPPKPATDDESIGKSWNDDAMDS